MRRLARDLSRVGKVQAQRCAKQQGDGQEGPGTKQRYQEMVLRDVVCDRFRAELMILRQR